MKIIKLMGGLGNQMFQYSFSQWLEEPVLFDVSWFDSEVRFKNLSFLKLYINDFNVKTDIASEKQIKECLKESETAKFLNKIGRNIRLKFLPSNRVYEKVINRFQPNLKTVKENVYYEGYYQSVKYLEKIRKNLLKIFVPRNTPEEQNLKLLDSIKSSESIAVSIRYSTDYQQLGWAIDKNFYIKAMGQIAEQVENPHFYIFTDNKEWSMSFLDNLKYNITYANSWDEKCGYSCGIYLMSQCNHNIIANSTYSWWGAYLNDNPEKIVYFPKKWLPKTSFPKTTYEELFLNDWISL